MQKIIFLLVLISASFNGHAQKTDLVMFEKERVRYSKNAMLVLGGWSVANIVGSGIATNTRNKEMRYFHQMNVMWGGINLGIAALGYLGTKNKAGMSLIESLKKQSSTACRSASR